MGFYYSCTIFISLISIVVLLNERLLNSKKNLSANTISFFTMYGFVILDIILVFFSTFRTCGTDLGSYESHFYEINLGNIFDFSIDKGYSLFVALLKYCSLTNFKAYLFVESLLYNSLFLFTIYRYRKNIDIFLSILAYVTLLYYTGFNILRIVLASSIVFYASKYLLSNKQNLYLVLVLIASTIHLSALFAILPIIIVKWSKSSFVKATLLCFLFGFVIYYVISKIDFLIPFLSDRYLSYMEDISVNNTIGLGTLLMNLPYFIAIYILYKQNYNRSILLIMYAISICSFLFSLLGYYSSIFSRLYIIFSLPYLFLLPMFVKNVQNKRLKNISFQIVLLYYLWRFNNYLSINIYSDGNVPYSFSF